MSVDRFRFRFTLSNQTIDISLAVMATNRTVATATDRRDPPVKVGVVAGSAAFLHPARTCRELS